MISDVVGTHGLINGQRRDNTFQIRKWVLLLLFGSHIFTHDNLRTRTARLSFHFWWKRLPRANICFCEIHPLSPSVFSFKTHFGLFVRLSFLSFSRFLFSPLVYFFIALRSGSVCPSLHKIQCLSYQHKGNKEIVERERQWIYSTS